MYCDWWNLVSLGLKGDSGMNSPNCNFSLEVNLFGLLSWMKVGGVRGMDSWVDSCWSWWCLLLWLTLEK